jgi:hypothetical protein
MIIAIVNSPTIDLYLINQTLDIILWSWISLIMIKRVICRGFDLRLSTIINSIKGHSFLSLTKKKLYDLIHNHHYYSDILLFLASLVAVVQFSNQFYQHSIGMSGILQKRTIIWMLFHKLIELSILIKYKKSQPKVFKDIVQEFKEFKILKKENMITVLIVVLIVALILCNMNHPKPPASFT